MKVSTPNPIKLVRKFSDVKSDMSRMDGNLTSWEHNGNTYPGNRVDDSFRSMARDLDNATLELGDLHPDQAELLDDLKDDTLDLAYNNGMTYSMNQQRTTFGSGWRNVMDPGIADADEAIDVLTNAEGEGVEKEQPNPMKLLRDLSDVRAELTRWDANFTQWSDNRRTYPSKSVSQNVLKVAAKLYDARNDFRTLHPEEAQLISNLQGDIINVAGDAGSTRHMYNRSITFGSGWSTSLDRPIESVRKAIDVLVASSEPPASDTVPPADDATPPAGDAI